MLSKTLKSYLGISFIFLIILISCRKDVVQETKMTYLTTDDKFLNSSGITDFNFRISSQIQLDVEYLDKSNKSVNNVHFTVDTLYRRSTIVGDDGHQKFSISLDERLGKFSLVSSLGDNKSFIFKTKEVFNLVDGWYDEETNNLADPNWYKSLKINYIIILKAHRILGELVKLKKFQNPLEKIKEREALIFMQQKLKLNTNKSGVTPYVEGNKCEGTCSSGIFYNWWQTQACNEAYNDLPAKCSNEYCVGNCGAKTCDCFGMTGDFLVACKAFGHSCTSGPIGIE